MKMSEPALIPASQDGNRLKLEESEDDTERAEQDGTPNPVAKTSVGAINEHAQEIDIRKRADDVYTKPQRSNSPRQIKSEERDNQTNYIHPEYYL